MTTSFIPRWSTLMPLVLLACIAHFCVDLMLGIWPIYKSLIHLDLAKAGFIVAIGALIGEGSQLIFGLYSDRGHRKFLILIGLIIATAASFFSYFNHYFVLFLLYLLTCIGSGCFHPAAASLMGSLIASKRSLLLTIFAFGGNLGLACSQLIYNYIYTAFGSYAFILALPAIIWALMIAFYPIPQVTSTVITHKTSLKDFLDFFKKPHFRVLYISQVANQSILWGMIFILPDVLKSLGHIEWVCHGGGHLCFVLGGACMMIPGGYLADAYSPRQVMLGAGIISFISFYFILFSGGISNIIVLLSLFILGASLTLINPLAISLGTYLEPNRPGAISAFLMGLVWCVSESLGPGGVGLMTQWFEDDAPVKALAILGCLFLPQIYATICLPKESKAIVAKSTG